MRVYENLIDYLSLPDSDLWFDDGSQQARLVLDSNQTELLSLVERDWHKLTALQQEHLAYILEVCNPQEKEILKKMSYSSIDIVAYRAKESLDEWK